MTDPTRSADSARRDAAATTRSYLFVGVTSTAVWLGLVVAAVAAAHHHGSSTTAVAVIVVVAVAVLWGWLAFLRGLHRRDLSRIEGLAPAPKRYDPRSK